MLDISLLNHKVRLNVAQVKETHFVLVLFLSTKNSCFDAGIFCISPSILRYTSTRQSHRYTRWWPIKLRVLPKRIRCGSNFRPTSISYSITTEVKFSATESLRLLNIDGRELAFLPVKAVILGFRSPAFSEYSWQSQFLSMSEHFIPIYYFIPMGYT